MDERLYADLKNTFKKDNLSLIELLSFFHVENFEEFIEILSTFINDNIKELSEDSLFFEDMHIFINHLITQISEESQFTSVLLFLKRLKNNLKDLIIDYNKNDLKKDSYYNYISSLINIVKHDINQTKLGIELRNENNDFKLIWFIINELQEPDYVFNFITNNPKYVNATNSLNKPLFISLIDFFVINIEKLDDKEIRYYKRIIVMLLESKSLKLTNDHLMDILKYIEDNKVNASIENKAHINFILNEIKRHYEIINCDARQTALDYLKKDFPHDIFKRNLDKRFDLRELYTVAIDTYYDDKNDKIIVEDAFSFEANPDGTFNIYVHVPDVDYFIKKDSELDLYMRSLGETVYAETFVKPMIPYSISRDKISLSASMERPAITIYMKIDSEGKVNQINYFKSTIKVNGQLSKFSVDRLLKNFDSIDNFTSLNHFSNLEYMAYIATLLRKSRKEKVGKRSSAGLIMDEFNIAANLATANLFNREGIVFPYKNFLGPHREINSSHYKQCEEYIASNVLPENINIYEMLETENRIFYDIINYGNYAFKGKAYGTITNPVREYISLETNRLIKDLLINNEGNIDYWQERIERDCIEMTETTSILKLYKND